MLFGAERMAFVMHAPLSHADHPTPFTDLNAAATGGRKLPVADAFIMPRCAAQRHPALDHDRGEGGGSDPVEWVGY